MFDSARPPRVRLHGLLGKALERSCDCRLKTVDYRQLTEPFRLRNETDNGWRCEFFDPHKMNNYNRKGVTLTAVVGEEIVSRDVDIKTKKRDESGFLLKSYTPKSEKRAG